MSYETEASDLPPVTDWVNDWDWLDDQWGSNAVRGPRNIPVVFYR